MPAGKDRVEPAASDEGAEPFRPRGGPGCGHHGGGPVREEAVQGPTRDHEQRW